MRHGDLGRVLRNVALVIGVVGVIALAALALFGPQLTASDPQAQRVVIFYPDGSFKVPPTPPDRYYPLGTDPLGRDQLARLLWGARLTFTVVLLALLLRALLAVALGVLAGWRGGNADGLITLVTDAIAGVPQLLLALLVAVALREHAIIGFVAALGCVGWAEAAQFVRDEVTRIRAAPYVEAAGALGARTRGIIGRHLLRALAPQLFGLLALEAGATLLLLAELGFLGVFMSGAIFYVDDAGRPILPVRDRAPEWGQMLAGAQQYAFSNQYVAFVPGVVVAAAVFTFNLLGEGARAATDPFSGLALAPRTLGAIGRAMAVLVLVSATVFGISAARSTELSFDDALRLAREAAQRTEPGDELIAAVVRFSSEAHALARPQKMNFYFRQPPSGTILRVGFPDADQNAMEVKRFDDEDGLVYELLGPLDLAGLVGWTRALATAEEQGGRAFRASTRTWLARIVLARQGDLTYYRGVYGNFALAAPSVDVFVDARSGLSDAPEFRVTSSRLRAEAALGGPVALVFASMSWMSATPTNRAGVLAGFGVERPTGGGYSYVRADLPNDTRVVTIRFGPGAGPPFVGSGSVRPPTLPASIDLEQAFLSVEREGGRAIREELVSRATIPAEREWSVQASASVQDGAVVVGVSYFVAAKFAATFRYDVATGRVERTR